MIKRVLMTILIRAETISRNMEKNKVLQDDIHRGVRGGLCNPSHLDGGILGWLEDGSPPWRLLVPLQQPHLS